MVHVTGEYYLDIDEKCVSLMVPAGTNKKTGKEEYRAIGYYSSIESAIEACIKRKIAVRLSDGDHTLGEALNIIRDEQKQTRELIRKAMEEK